MKKKKADFRWGWMAKKIERDKLDIFIKKKKVVKDLFI